MKIKQIQNGMNGVTVFGRITRISEKQEVETKYGKAFVANAILEDDTGKIVLNLWRDQIDMMKVGDKVRIENGFVQVFQQRLELNVGKRGKITVIK